MRHNNTLKRDYPVAKCDDFFGLPYENKICFVPFTMHEKGIVSIEYKKECEDLPFFNKETIIIDLRES